MTDSFWRSVHELAETRGHALHMPGHGNTTPVEAEWGARALPHLLMALDQSEIGGLDYLHDAQGPLAQAQQRAAALFGADTSWFLVNGATVGNLAAIWSVARPGGHLVVMRRSHQSVHAAATIASLEPRYLTPLRHEPLDGLFAFDIAELAALLAAESDVAGVHVTSPDYYGFRLPLESIADLCHAHGVPLVVDEAHGAHLYFLDGEPTALASGADLVVHSPHKTLGSLTQSALLHSQGPLVDPQRVSEALVLLQSSSPSSLLTMSLDAVLEDLQHSGRQVWAERAEWARQARERDVQGRTLFVNHEALPPGVARADPCKLLVSSPRLTGRLEGARARLLSDHGIRPEFGDHRSLVFSIVRGTRRSDVEQLCAALGALAGEAGEMDPPAASTVALWPDRLPTQASQPRPATQAARTAVPLGQAAGRVAARPITPYPPGVPLVLPGEVISPEVVGALEALAANGVVIRGLVDTTAGKGALCVATPEDRSPHRFRRHSEDRP